VQKLLQGSSSSGGVHWS